MVKYKALNIRYAMMNRPNDEAYLVDIEGNNFNETTKHPELRGIMNKEVNLQSLISRFLTKVSLIKS